MVMMKEEHNGLLRQFLEGPSFLREMGQDICRGSDLDNLQFYQAVESCGATVVARITLGETGYLKIRLTRLSTPGGDQ